jgi:hypothetical protein
LGHHDVTDAPAAPASPRHESPWESKLKALRPPYSIELGVDTPVSEVMELTATARAVGYDGIVIARGGESAPVRTRSSGAGSVDELLLVVQSEGAWSLDWWTRTAGLRNNTGSGFGKHIGRDVANVMSKWTDAPCSLSVSAIADVPFSVVTDGAFGISRAHPCIRGFAFGLFAKPPYVDSTVWEPGSGGARVLTVQVPESPPEHPTPVIREKRTVRVDGAVETWRIQWRDSPSTTCMSAWNCICGPFGHAQRGEADLIRSRPGSLEEVFPLSSIFPEGLDTPPIELSDAILRAWRFDEHDSDESADAETLARMIEARKLVPFSTCMTTTTMAWRPSSSCRSAALAVSFIITSPWAFHAQIHVFTSSAPRRIRKGRSSLAAQVGKF